MRTIRFDMFMSGIVDVIENSRPGDQLIFNRQSAAELAARQLSAIHGYLIGWSVGDNDEFVVVVRETENTNL